MILAQGHEISSEVMVGHLRIRFRELDVAKAPPGDEFALRRAD